MNDDLLGSRDSLDADRFADVNKPKPRKPSSLHFSQEEAVKDGKPGFGGLDTERAAALRDWTEE